MKILHIGDCAGVASQLAAGQRTLGHQADVLEVWRSPVGYPHDLEDYYEGIPRGIWAMLRTARRCGTYDVVHVHGGISRKRLDLVLAKLKGVPVVTHYHGSDLRMGYGGKLRWLPDAEIVSTPDLLRYRPEATFIPNPFDARSLQLLNLPVEPRLLHMPTDRRLKGSAVFTEAALICSVIAKNRFHYYEPAGLISHREALREISRSSVVLDQVGDVRTTGVPGLIGMASLEGMAMGRASIAYMDPDLRPFYPGLPVQSPKEPNAEATAKVITELIDDPSKLREIGRKGRDYVLERHDTVKIAKRHLEIYEGVLA